MKRPPFISICIPTYNSEKYIAEAIESVLDQTFTDFELLIVDNASSDSTIEVVERFKDKRISIYKNSSNLGIHANHNLCMKYASGKYIHLLGSDDKYLNNSILESIFKNIQSSQIEPSVIGVKSSQIEDQNSIGKIKANNYTTIDGVEAVREILLHILPYVLIPSLVFFKRELIYDNKKIVEKWEKKNEISYGDDTEFYFRIIKKSNYLFIDRFMILYRIHSESLTEVASKSGKALQFHIEIMNRWIRGESIIPLTFIEKKWIMSGEYIRIKREEKDSEEKIAVLKNNFQNIEKLFVILRKLGGLIVPLVYIKEIKNFLYPSRASDQIAKLLHRGSEEKFLLPLNFDSNNTRFDFFKSIKMQSSPDIFLYQLKKIIINDKGIIYDSNNNINIDIYEPSEQKKYLSLEQKNKLYVRNLRHPRRYFLNMYRKISFSNKIYLDANKSYIIFTDDRAINNVYHWFCDTLVKLIAYGKLRENQKIILPENCWKNEYVQSSLIFFGITKSDIFVIPKGTKVYLDSLEYLSNSIFTPASSNGLLLNKLREFIYKSFDDSSFIEPSKKIYISRKNSKHRNVFNNSEFNDFIKSYGFEEICAEDYNLNELIKILINTKYLMGIVGANLFHTLFMQKGGFVIELIHSNFVKPSDDDWPGQYKDKYYGLHYAYMANSLSLSYLYIPCKPLDSRDKIGRIDQDLIVDLNELKNHLDPIM